MDSVVHLCISKGYIYQVATSWQWSHMTNDKLTKLSGCFDNVCEINIWAIDGWFQVQSRSISGWSVCFTISIFKKYPTRQNFVTEMLLFLSKGVKLWHHVTTQKTITQTPRQQSMTVGYVVSALWYSSIFLESPQASCHQHDHVTPSPRQPYHVWWTCQ